MPCPIKEKAQKQTYRIPYTLNLKLETLNLKP